MNLPFEILVSRGCRLSTRFDCFSNTKQHAIGSGGTNASYRKASLFIDGDTKRHVQGKDEISKKPGKQEGNGRRRPVRDGVGATLASVGFDNGFVSGGRHGSMTWEIKNSIPESELQ
jgi:hypothetical protein